MDIITDYCNTQVREVQTCKDYYKLSHYKQMAKPVEDALYIIGMRKRAQRMHDCATYAVFGVNPNDGGHKLMYANFCRDRLCPACQWRRTIKTGGQMRQIFTRLHEEQDCAFVFLTLTQPSCKTADLGTTFDAINLAYRRMIRRKRFRFVLGAYRAVEVTRNVDSDSPSYGLWHPHMHIVWMVRKSYFHSRDYLSVAALRSEWLDCLLAEGYPCGNNPLQVHMEGVRGVDLAAATAEVCKYPIKPTSIITGDVELDTETVQALAVFARGRRFVNLSGAIKQMHHDLHLADLEDDNASLDDPLEDGWLYYGYMWSHGLTAYILSDDAVPYMRRRLSLSK